MENINIFIDSKDSFVPKAKYVFETIFKILGIKPHFFTEFTMEDIHIYYGEKTTTKYPITIYHNLETVDFFTKRKLYEGDKVNLVKYGDEFIPFLFSKQGKIVHYTSQTAELRKDIIASAFYFLSCWQEYASAKLIEPNNFFKYKSSLQYLHGFTEIPVVDRYCEIVHGILINIFSEYVVDNIWQKENKFAFSLSYNIDYWKFWTKDHINMLQQRKDKFFSRKNFTKKVRIITHKMGLKYIDFKFVLRLIIKHGKSINSSSSFFILTHDQFPDKRMNYFSDERMQAQVVRTLQDSYINLQGTKEAGYQLDYLQTERERMGGFSNQGFRVRYLNFNYQNLFTILEKEKIKFDSSVGFYEAIGFRAGISYPFFPYNIKEDRKYDVLEVPIAATDRALYKLAGGNARKARQKMFQLLKNAQKHRSHFSMVWHNHLFDRVDFPGWASLYWKINMFDNNKGRWICSTDEMVEFWLKK